MNNSPESPSRIEPARKPREAVSPREKPETAAGNEGAVRTRIAQSAGTEEAAAGKDRAAAVAAINHYQQEEDRREAETLITECGLGSPAGFPETAQDRARREAEWKRIKSLLENSEDREARAEFLRKVAQSKNPQLVALLSRPEKANPDNWTGSDLEMMRFAGADIVSLIARDPRDPRKPVDLADAREGMAFRVNLGPNSKANGEFGPFHLLAATGAKTISINGAKYEYLAPPQAPEAEYYARRDRKLVQARVSHGDTVVISSIAGLDEETAADRTSEVAGRAVANRIDATERNEKRALSNAEIDTKIVNYLRSKSYRDVSEDANRLVGNVGDMDGRERRVALQKTFGPGPATDLLVKIENQLGKPDPHRPDRKEWTSGIGIARMLALAVWEGRCKFGKPEVDKVSGNNLGTFQIGGADSTAEQTRRKYARCLNVGAGMAGIDPREAQKLSAAQKDLLAHMGFIQKERGGEDTFRKLCDPNLSKQDACTLMAKTIQGGDAKIGLTVWALTQPDSELKAQERRTRETASAATKVPSRKRA